jgi:hypothetical protein
LAVEIQSGSTAVVGPPRGLENPRRVYAERLEARRGSAQELDRKLDRLGSLRLLVFGIGLVLVWLVFVSRIIGAWWLALPAVAFVFLLFRYDRVRRAGRKAQRAVSYYEFGLDRLEDRWPGRGHAGQRFLDENHLYALDLDIFGRGSLFERLCIARTGPGEDTLASWLRAPAAAEEIQARQESVADLRPRLELREDLALLGAEVPPVDYSALVNWGKAPVLLHGAPLRLLILVLGLFNLLAVGTFLLELASVALVSEGLSFRVGSLLVVVAFACSIPVALWLGPRVRQVLDPIEPMGRDLFLLAALLQRIEQEHYTAPRLRELRLALQVEGAPPSWQIGRLAGLVDWLNSMKNQFFLPIGLLLLFRTQLAFAVEVWRKRSGPAFGPWLTAIGSLEALNSLAAYAFENPDDPFPQIVIGPPVFSGEDLGHPLLPRDHCVRNDVCLGGEVQALLVSGSNMSGKSTLLRTVGTNAVLALAGAPVRAGRLRLTPLAIGATLRIQDSLLAGRSRFFAEISRIRQILDAAAGPLPVLFLLDELFHGTNSHDRGIGAGALLARLLASGAIGLVTTHDLSLTRIADTLGASVRNVHFADQFVDGKMTFDYKMRPGVVPHSNALALMRAIGLEV